MIDGAELSHVFLWAVGALSLCTVTAMIGALVALTKQAEYKK